MTIQDTYCMNGVKGTSTILRIVLFGIFYFINFVFPRSRAWKTAKRYPGFNVFIYLLTRCIQTTIPKFRNVNKNTFIRMTINIFRDTGL